jgi:hypothetical protein
MRLLLQGLLLLRLHGPPWIPAGQQNRRLHERAAGDAWNGLAAQRSLQLAEAGAVQCQGSSMLAGAASRAAVMYSDDAYCCML